MSSSEIARQVCRHCGTTVPAADFCGYCGADFNQPAQGLRSLLRPAVFAAAPTERVLLPMVTSTLFPQLPRTNRNPFRIGMAVMLTGVVVLSVLRWHGPLVSLVALGVPALFMLYLWQADILRDIPIRAFAVAATTGGALGVGWVSFTGSLIARSHGISTAAGFVLQALIGVGLLISLGGAILMVVPAVVVRLLIGIPTREALDGFAIGALGALSFTAAATTTRLAPQFVTGLIGRIPPLRLLIEAVLYGVTVPLTAAAAGGLIGIVLWFRPGKRAADHPTAVRLVLVMFTLLVVVIYTAIWVIDASRLPKWPQLVLHIVITVGALLSARFCLQLALLHEKPDQFTSQPLLCLHCDRVIPDMPFCPACGAAARASSRSSRRRRREYPPVKV
jgi:RNA polymerase subunit RPABC4/transcription elongation factor Spt4